MIQRWLGVTMLCLTVAGCEGPMGPAGPQGERGPAGPQGPVGPQGPEGSTTRYIVEGQLDASGGGGGFIPGNVGNPPAVTCFISDRQNGTYLAINGENGTCGYLQSTSSSTMLFVGVVSSIPFYYYRVVSVY